MSAYEIDDDVLAEIEEHAFSDVRHEVGGVLIGLLDGQTAHIQASLPALQATADQTSVTFTHDVWDAVHATLDKEHPGKAIVGWYHTHPGFGVFLSSYDTFIHENFFSDKRMVALVVDPVAGESGWFAWRKDEVQRVETFATTRAAVAAPSTHAPLSSRQAVRRKAAPLLLLAGLVLAVGGYALGQHVEATSIDGARDSVDPVELANLRDEVAALQSESTDLRERLGRARGDNAGTTITYRIRPGDTLSTLAYALYGDVMAYQVIVAANPGIDPDQLAVGQQIAIPVRVDKGD